MEKGIPILIEPKVYEEFCKIAAKKGLDITTWVNEQLKEFILDEQLFEDFGPKNK